MSKDGIVLFATTPVRQLHHNLKIEQEWRKALVFSCSVSWQKPRNSYIELSVCDQLKRYDCTWETIWSSDVGFSITSHFCLGSEHIYYDGPFCSFSLGFLHIIWHGNPKTGECKKCLPD